MILDLTNKEIEDMLSNELKESGEYIESVGSWVMSTLEAQYDTYAYGRKYDEIVKDNFDRFYDIAEKMW